MALYIPHSIFPFGAAFVCQAGNFWTLLRVYLLQLFCQVRKSDDLGYMLTVV